MPLCITSDPGVNKSVSRPERKNTLTHSRRYQPQKGFLPPPYPPRTFSFHVLPAFHGAPLPRGSFITQQRQWTIMDHCSCSMWQKGHSSAMFLPPLTSHPATSAPSSSPHFGFNLHAGIISTAHQGWSLRRKQAFPCVNILGWLGQVRVSFQTEFFSDQNDCVLFFNCCSFSLAAFISTCHDDEDKESGFYFYTAAG